MRSWCHIGPATWLLIRRRLSQGQNIRSIARMVGVTRKEVYKVRAGNPAIRRFIDCGVCGYRNRHRDRHCRKCKQRFYSGMTGQIKRAGNEIALELKDELAGSTPLDYKPWAGGRIKIPVGSSITQLTFYEGPSFGGDTHLTDPEAFTECGDVPPMTVEDGKSYELPAALFGAHALVIVANTPGDVLIWLKG